MVLGGNWIGLQPLRVDILHHQHGLAFPMLMTKLWAPIIFFYVNLMIHSHMLAKLSRGFEWGSIFINMARLAGLSLLHYAVQVPTEKTNDEKHLDSTYQLSNKCFPKVRFAGLKGKPMFTIKRYLYVIL